MHQNSITAANPNCGIATSLCLPQIYSIGIYIDQVQTCCPTRQVYTLIHVLALPFRRVTHPWLVAIFAFIKCKFMWVNVYLCISVHIDVCFLYKSSVEVCPVFISPTCSFRQRQRDNRKSLSAYQAWHTLPVHIRTQRQSELLPPLCIHTLPLNLTDLCQCMPQIMDNYYLQCPRKTNGLTQPGCKHEEGFYFNRATSKMIVFVWNMQSRSHPVCHCGSEAARAAERLSLSVFFKAKHINGLSVWPSHALCTTWLLCIVVGLMLLTSISLWRETFKRYSRRKSLLSISAQDFSPSAYACTVCSGHFHPPTRGFETTEHVHPVWSCKRNSEQRILGAWSRYGSSAVSNTIGDDSGLSGDSFSEFICICAKSQPFRNALVNKWM